MYTVELLKAISDWQKGGYPELKKKRGIALLKAAENLPKVFREINSSCYRKLNLDKRSVWDLGTKYLLDETISSWTTSLDVAKEFKGGVPPVGSQGAIFVIEPADEYQVIVNLELLFGCEDFLRFVDENKHKVNGYSKGMGKYKNSQKEVIINTTYINMDSIVALGGYSSSDFELASQYYKHTPNKAEMESFYVLMKKAGCESGKHWLTTPAAIKRVVDKYKYHGARLSSTIKNN
ncbi:hypothetical protein ACSZNN_09960 [Aeromonas hydrophila]